MRDQIYNNLKKVPKGKVVTYKELAKSVDSKAYRVVGSYMKTNAHPEKIPCYKVVNSDGSVGNYSGVGGINSKIKKLKNDGIVIENNKIDLDKFGYKFDK